MSSPVYSLPELLEKIGEFPRDRKVILCHGCFDIIHPGHVRHLTYAKSKADVVIVSLTSDRHITKGIYRPHVPEQIRADCVNALKIVDYVVIDDHATALELIDALKPDYFAKGFEYGGNNPATLAETQAVESYGGKMIFTPGDIIYSSTKLLNSHLPKLHIEKLISLMKRFDITFEGLKDAVEKFKDFKAHVVGDTIIDTYTRTNLIGANAKTPTFSVIYDGHEDYVGGAAIVAQHIKKAGADVTFTTVIGNDKKGRFASECLKSQDIKVEAIIDENRPTTHKNTIIAGDTRLLKIDTLDNTPITGKVVAEIGNIISRTETDAVIFSDFRHGMFNKAIIPELTAAISHNALKIADSQVASRWGNITEFQGFDLVVPNEKEARFALADQDSSIGTLITLIQEKCDANSVIIKLGKRGVFFLEGLAYSVDSFADRVVDAVGAGDAFLAYATLTLLATKSLPMACIIGSMAAACECEIDGNVPIKPEQVLQKLEWLEKAI